MAVQDGLLGSNANIPDFLQSFVTNRGATFPSLQSNIDPVVPAMQTSIPRVYKGAVGLFDQLGTDGDSEVIDAPPAERSAANNWGYLGTTGRGVLSGLQLATGLPVGLIGAVNDYQAMQMGRSGYGTQFSPSFFDTLTMGLFDYTTDFDGNLVKSGMYDQSVLNMEQQNIAGRSGLLGDPKSPLGQAKFMDYTHQYGDEEPMDDRETQEFESLQQALTEVPDYFDPDEAGEEEDTNPGSDATAGSNIGGYDY
tara:strand:+ start:885 stop:1640 length:756 start_codon:yes stop_codon:yes gene_type:complete